MSATTITNITPENVITESLFCIKDIKKPGFESKRKWFIKRFNEGLRLKILKDLSGKMIGFIEYVPTEFAWRPIIAEKFMFIHCMYTASKKIETLGMVHY
jgi:hypothetical protein